MLAGVVAPAEATWAALMVLYTACLQYGVPEHLVSDGGGAYTSNAFEAVCQRLAIDHRTITSGAGESWKNLMVTVERRIAPPPAVPERGVIVSSHPAPQCRDAWHAYGAGGSRHAPAFSHRGSVHGALAGWLSAYRVDLH